MMPTRTELPPRFGRYLIVKKLGEGGMGAVYLAEDTQLGRRVALKVPHFSGEGDPTSIERFHREAKVAAGIEHPGVCPVYDVGAIDGIHFLTMPFIDGIPLSRKVDPESPLPPKEAAGLVYRLALAVQTMHERGVIHRDLKPGNVLLRAGGAPVVMDFGLARSFSGVDRVTATGAQVGTPAYMSPEQIMGQQEELGPGTDVYSLGVILFELLTGRVPFTGPLHTIYNQVLHGEVPIPSRLRPGLNAELDAVCLKAMAKNSADRHASMAAFAAALLKFVDEAATAPPPVGTASGETVRPERWEATIPTGSAGPDLTEAPATRSSVTALAVPTQKQRSRLGRRGVFLGIGATMLGAAILLGVLYAQGVFDAGTDEKPESQGKVEREEDPLDRIRRAVKPRASKGSTQVDTWQGKTRYNYYLWLEGPAEVLNQIDNVQYHFNPRLFTPALQESSIRGDGFQIKYVGIGAVDRDMDITLMLRDGKKVTVQFNVWKAIHGE